MVLRIPSWLREEWAFWLFASIASFLPGRLMPIWGVLGVRATAANWLLVVAGILSLVRLALLPKNFAPVHGLSRALQASFCGILAYAAVSMVWSRTKWDVMMQMSFTLLAAGSASMFAYVSIRKKPIEAIRPFLGRVAAFLCVVAGVYLLESVFGLGLHGPNAILSEDFGIARLNGPLFEASTGYLLLIPALAFQIEALLSGQKRLPLGILTSMILIMSILALGSKAGLILLGLFAVGIVTSQQSLGRLLAGASLTIFGVALAWALVFSRATAGRLTDLADTGRMDNHIAAFNTMQHRGILDNLAGSGYGSVWPWYAAESEALGNRNLFAEDTLTRDTREGAFLFHSHSTFLLLVVELGIAGLAFAAALVFSIGRMLVNAIRARVLPTFAVGVAVSLLSLGFDLFLFRHPARDLLWWVFLFGGSALIQSEKTPRRAGVCAGTLLHSRYAVASPGTT
jgi:O-antigen ligase